MSRRKYEITSSTDAPKLGVTRVRAKRDRSSPEIVSPELPLAPKAATPPKAPSPEGAKKGAKKSRKDTKKNKDFDDLKDWVGESVKEANDG